MNRTAWPPLLHRVVRTVRSRSLIQPGQHVLVAISGGPDSVALLSLLHHLRSHWRLTLTAVHCNYGLRGAESEGDQRFVETLCHTLDVPLHVHATRVGIHRRHSSFQAEARDIRYRTLRETGTMCGAERIAVGHTANDQAETVLLWILRGAGLAGLSGMPAVRNETIVRPLYETTRQEILAYLRTSGLSYRDDSSNAKPLYRRNRIRREVIPLLTQVVPSTIVALCRLGDLCRADDRYLDQETVARMISAVTWGPAEAWTLDRLMLLNFPLPLQRRCLRLLFRQGDSEHRSPNLSTIDRVIRLASTQKSGTRVQVRAGQIVVTDRSLRFLPCPIGPECHQDHRPNQTTPAPLPVPGELIWSGTGQRLQVQVQRYDSRQTSLGQEGILVDADRISQPLTVRSWLPGDRFCPNGMGGQSKKLQDFFTDVKIPIAARARIPMVIAPEGVVWIVGYRQDERWVPTSSTTRCLVIRVDPPPLTKGRD